MRMFENRVLRIFGLKRDEVAGHWSLVTLFFAKYN
jgi:hypothetical protein